MTKQRKLSRLAQALGLELRKTQRRNGQEKRDDRDWYLIDPLHILLPKYLADLDAVDTILAKAAAKHPERVQAEGNGSNGA